MQEKLAGAVSTMAEYSPDLQRLEVFGDPGQNMSTKEPIQPDKIFPLEDQVKDFPVYRRIKLSKI